MRNTPLLTVVIPIYNEVEILDLSLGEFRKVLDSMEVDYEVIGVNDGSTDGTTQKIESWTSNWSELKVIHFVSNRGHMAALTAGLEQSKGQWVATIDVDLQDPPSVIPVMLEMANKENVDVVYGLRGERSSDTWLRKHTANLFYKFLGKLVNVEVPQHGADCRLMSRRVVNSLNSLTEKQKIYRLLVPWLGYPSSEYHYARQTRQAGSTHYSIGQLTRLATNSVTSFSAAPLRLAIWISVVGILSLFVVGIYVSIGWFQGDTPEGWTSTMLLVLLMGSLQLLSLGIIGEYISKIFIEVQSRPTYEIQRISEKQQELDS